MQTKNNGGDVLARGGVRATFNPAEGVTQKKWDDIFADYTPEKTFIKPKETPSEFLVAPQIPEII